MLQAFVREGRSEDNQSLAGRQSFDVSQVGIACFRLPEVQRCDSTIGILRNLHRLLSESGDSLFVIGRRSWLCRLFSVSFSTSGT